MPLIFAAELGVPLEVEPVPDMKALESVAYGGNPALKLPILRVEGTVLFGALNICRALAERGSSPKLIFWPEQATDMLSRNAQELVWHAMAAQVQLVMGTVVNGLPADNAYFVKSRAGLEGALRWLDARVGQCIAALPPRGLSVFEVSLFCLVEHLAFRPTVPLDPYRELTAFCGRFGSRESARQTAYRFD
jgi:glutathione S-transferase